MIGSHTRKWPLYFLSILLLAVMLSILFGGAQALLMYRNSADPSTDINTSTLRFFTKEYILRRYLELTVRKLPEQTTLPSFRFYATEWDLDSLVSDLPDSAKTRFIPGFLKVDKSPFTSEVKFRYRGGLPLHWLYKKKSFRIKLPPFITYRGERSFNLVNPSSIHTVTDWVSYDMARSLGLLTPDYFPARVFVNNETNGLHFFLSRIDESFLRKNHRMPGSIYSGDTIYIPDPFGLDHGENAERNFIDENSESLIWEDSRLWSKDSARNLEEKNDRIDIEKYIQIINLQDPLDFMRDFERYFNKDKFYTFWGLDTLVGAYHHDNFHNHKIYFDPYKGQFEPIEWDIRYWSGIFLTKDLPIYPLLRQIILNPVLEYQRDKRVFELMRQFPVEEVCNRIEQAGQELRKELEADPLRQAPDQRYGRFAFNKFNKEVPFSMKEYDYALEELEQSYRKRYEFLQQVYANAFATYTMSKIDDNNIALTVSVFGNSPIDFSPWSLLPNKFRSGVHITYERNGRMIPVAFNDVERLYPGRTMVAGNVLDRVDVWAILAFGREKPRPTPLHYKYIIQGTSAGDLDLSKTLKATNSITGSEVELSYTDNPPSDANTSSIHPRELPESNRFEKVILSGLINVTDDRVFTESQQVTIRPGTVFRIAKNRSLIFYGKVSAEGTKKAPIQFMQSVKGEPWGSIVIQGQKASGTHLRHIVVSGGSVTSRHMIDYSGELNIHDVDNFKLENCLIKANVIGDDALHIAYSKGEIKNCRFEDTAFDALDADISELKLSNLEFFNSGNDALDIMTSKINVNNVRIQGTGDKCFSVGEESDINIFNSQISNCSIGIAVKDNSRAYIEDLQFRENIKSAISLYQKNPRYGFGGTVDGKRLFGITAENIDLSSTSVSYIKSEEFLPLSALDGNVINSLPEQVR